MYFYFPTAGGGYVTQLFEASVTAYDDAVVIVIVTVFVTEVYEAVPFVA